MGILNQISCLARESFKASGVHNIVDRSFDCGGCVCVWVVMDLAKCSEASHAGDSHSDTWSWSYLSDADLRACVCVCVCAVSYTHLTLPTTAEV